MGRLEKNNPNQNQLIEAHEEEDLEEKEIDGDH